MTVRSANGRAGSAIFLLTNALRSAIAKDVRLKRVTKLQQAAFFDLSWPEQCPKEEFYGITYIALLTSESREY